MSGYWGRRKGQENEVKHGENWNEEKPQWRWWKGWQNQWQYY